MQKCKKEKDKMLLRDLITVLDKDTQIVLNNSTSVIDHNTKWYRNYSKIPMMEMNRSVISVEVEHIEGIDEPMFWIVLGNEVKA
jgi:hypothetical protein